MLNKSIANKGMTPIDPKVFYITYINIGKTTHYGIVYAYFSLLPQEK